MTTTEKSKVIAEYDGWKYESEEWDMMYKISDGFWYNPDREELDEHCNSIEEVEYSTSYDWLIPVAQKVYKELVDIKFQYKNHTFRICEEITRLQGTNPICGGVVTVDHVFEVVYQGIELLNRIKNEGTDEK